MVETPAYLRHLLLACTMLDSAANLGAFAQVRNASGDKLFFQKKLLTHLFTNYDRDVHPGANEPVNVSFGAKLGRITQVDEKNNVVRAQWYIKQCWINPALTWNASEFGSVTKLHVDPSRVWVPDIVLYNNADPKTDTAGGLHKYQTQIEIKHDGNAMWLAPAMFHSVCHMDIRYFPFDEQHCHLQFASWAYDVSRLDLEIDRQETRLIKGFYNKEWHTPEMEAVKKLVNYTCCPHPYGDITIKLTLVRQPYYYVMNMIFPCSLIACMTFLTFVLPAESGERISLCITVLMAMSIFQELTSQKLPPSSETFFLLGVYYTVTITAVGLGLAATCIVINFYYKKTKMSPWMKTILLGRLADILGVERTYLRKSIRGSSRVIPNGFWEENDADLSLDNEAPRVDQNDVNEVENGVESVNMENGGGPNNSPRRKRKTIKTLERVKSSRRMKLKEEENQVRIWQEEWKTASRVADRLALILGVLLAFGATVTIFLQAPRVRAFAW